MPRFVTIGDHRFAVKGYRWRPDSAPVTRNDIPGKPGDETLLQGFRSMEQTDWSGGEGFKFYDPQNPIVFDNGECNPRIPGKLKGVPARHDANYTPVSQDPVFCATGGGAVWLVGERSARYTTDLTLATWTAATPTIPAAQQITAIAGGPDGVYLWSAQDPTVVRSPVELRWCPAGGASKTVATTGGGNGSNALGIAFLAGTIWYWSGAVLKSYDVTDQTAWPLTVSPGVRTLIAFNFKDGSETFATPHYGGITATDTSVAFFYADSTDTQVYEWTGTPASGSGAPLWHLPKGFSGRAITFAGNSLYLVGTTGPDAYLFSLNLVTLEEKKLGYIRQGSSLVPTCISPGPDDQVIIGMATGEVFVYSSDPSANSITELGHRTGMTNLGGVVTYGNKRMAAFRDDTGTKFQSSYWDDDITDSTQSGTNIMPAWDWAIPEQDKTLIGVQIGFKPFLTTETIDVSYQINEDAAYVALPQITLTTVDLLGRRGSGGRIFLPIPENEWKTTVAGGLTRFKVVVNNGGEVYNFIPRAYVLDYQELLILDIDLYGDEFNLQSPEAFEQAAKKRSYIRKLIRDRKIVTVIDEIGSELVDHPDVYQMILEFPTSFFYRFGDVVDEIPVPGQYGANNAPYERLGGIITLQLRKVSSSG